MFTSEEVGIKMLPVTMPLICMIVLIPCAIFSPARPPAATAPPTIAAASNPPLAIVPPASKATRAAPIIMPASIPSIPRPCSTGSVRRAAGGINTSSTLLPSAKTGDHVLEDATEISKPAFWRSARKDQCHSFKNQHPLDLAHDSPVGRFPAELDKLSRPVAYSHVI